MIQNFWKLLDINDLAFYGALATMVFLAFGLPMIRKMKIFKKR